MLPEIRSQLWKMLPDSDPENRFGLAGTGYNPPSDVHLAMLDDPSPTILVSGGERGAKSHTSSMKALLLTLDFIAQFREKACGEVGWIVARSYDLTRPEFEYISGWLARTPLAVDDRGRQLIKASPSVNPGYITIPVIKDRPPFTIKTKSADDPMGLRAEAPIWTLMCEAALMTQDTYFRLYGRMGEVRSKYPGFGTLLMSGTFEGSLGWYPTLWTKWQSEAAQKADRAKSYAFPSSANKFAFPGGENDPELLRLKETLPPDVFAERHLAVPAPPTGRVHDRFDSTVHVRKTEYDPQAPIYVSIDPGYSGQPSHYAVEVLQKRENGQWQVIDEIWESKLTGEEICDIAMSKWWWKNPMKVGVVDIAGTTHAGAQESTEEVWLKRTGLVLMHEKVNVMPGIDRFNMMLEVDPLTKEPRMVIDPRCHGVLSELGHEPSPDDGQVRIYSWAKDREGNVIGRVPQDRYNDGIKALTYLFVNQLGYASHRGMSQRRVIEIKRRRDLIAARP